MDSLTPKLFIPTTDFQSELNDEIKDITNTTNNPELDPVLKDYQNVVLHYIKRPVRGVLIYHQMGMGKTITASAIARFLQSKGYKVVFLSAKALHSNFEKGMKKYDKLLDEKTKTSSTQRDDNVSYITANSSNIFSKIKNVLDNSVLIVDEAHNMFNTIVNGSELMHSVYDLIMNTKRIKILFMSGSLPINDPFELVPCFNMLAGPLPRNNTLFPEIREHFVREFVSESGLLWHKEKFQDRITGYISYAGETYDPGKQRPGFPKELPEKIIKLKMSEYQSKKYHTAKVAEDKEMLDAAQKKSKHKIDTSRFTKPGSSGYSSYRIKTRQVCNFVFPFDIPKIKTFEDTVGKLTDEHFKNMDKYGPKFDAIYKNIKSHPKELHLFYSFFVDGPGVSIMERYLKFNGYEKWTSKKHNIPKPLTNKDSGTTERKLRYASINGSVPIPERDAIIEAWNRKSNINGNDIHVLLISSTGIEGLDLHNIRHIYQLEPAWNFRVTRQLKARGIRLNAHLELPASQRNVQFYMYLMEFPGKSTDEHMYELSLKKERTNASFQNAMIESAIECAKFNKNPSIKCRSCYPTSEPLYYPEFYTDIHIPTKCKKPKEIEAEEVIIDGKKYYKYNNKFYVYDENYQAYVPASLEKENSLEKSGK